MGLKKRIWLVYLGGFLLAVHYASVAYVNSSLLQLFAKDSTLNILYIIGAILSLIFLALAPFFIRRYGSVATFLIFIGLEMIAVFGMGSSHTALLIFLLFLLHSAGESMLYLSLDVNLEQEIKTEGTTGRKRSLFLTIQNIAWVMAPLAVAYLVSAGNFKDIYSLSGYALIPLFLITLLFFKDTKQTESKTSSIIPAFKSLFKGGDKVRIIGTQFMLQFFFSWMIIYLPLLLNKEIGFAWGQIGIILTIMLIPFVIFEMPAGFLSDKKFGEKEVLIFGFSVMVLATLVIPSLSAATLWIWALVLFATRIGASLVEISSESYFFKHVKEDDTALISLFRMARPLSFIIAPLIALPVVYFFSYSTSFYFLALFTLAGLLFIPKKDTK